MKLNDAQNGLLLTETELTALVKLLNLTPNNLSTLHLNGLTAENLEQVKTELEKLDDQTNQLMTKAVTMLAQPEQLVALHYTIGEKQLGRMVLCLSSEPEKDIAVLAKIGHFYSLNLRSPAEIFRLAAEVLMVDTNLATCNFSISLSSTATITLLALADCYRADWYQSMLTRSLPVESYTASEVTALIKDRAADFRWPLQFFAGSLSAVLADELEADDVLAGLLELIDLELISPDRNQEEEEPYAEALYSLGDEVKLLSEGLMNNAGKVVLNVSVLDEQSQVISETMFFVRDAHYLWLFNLSGSLSAVASIDRDTFTNLLEAQLSLKTVGAAIDTGTPNGQLNQGYEGYPSQPQAPSAGTPEIPQAGLVVPSPPPPLAPKPASPFEEVAARYAVIKAELDQGAINRDQFLQQVNELRFQDASGTWWQIAEDGKGWLRWDGANWVKQISN